MTLISGTPLPTWKKLEPVRVDLATAKPLDEVLKPTAGRVWCQESFTALLKESGLASTGEKVTLRSGINLHAFQLTSEQMGQAAALLADGKTALGPLQELEKKNQLNKPASEIEKQAKQRLDKILKVGEGLSYFAEAAAKLDTDLEDPADEFAGVFAILDLVNQVRSSDSKSRVETTLALTADFLLILNAIALVLPHGDKYQPALRVAGLVVKGTKGTYAAFRPPSQPGRSK